MPDMTSLSLMGQQNFMYILPETILTVGIMVVIGLTILTHKKAREENEALMLTSLLFILLSLAALIWNFNHSRPLTPEPILFGSMTADLFGYIMRGLLLIGAGITVAVSHRYLEQNTRIIGDFYALIMGATLGGMFLASASDLVTVFVGLETLSITSYILAGYLRKTARSAEASFKYLIYGGASTAIFLFGLSLVYGLAGSTNFKDIAVALVQFQGITHPTLIVMMIMVFAALAFKLSAAPFHMWAPDVYEGAPTPVAAFLSVVSKTAAIAITLRLVVILFSHFAHWTVLWIILSVLSMTIGNFVALKQTNIKRLLAYSTVAHAGYMLLGLAVGTAGGIGALIYYLMTYVFMNLGAFASVIYFNTLTRTDDISAYSGLIQKRPWLAAGFSICLLSLTGIPITAGFFAKFFLFQLVAMSDIHYLWLIIIALLNSTISLAYYINIIRLMVVKEPSTAVAAIPASTPVPWALTTALTISVVATILMGIFATPLFDLSSASAAQLAEERAMMATQVQPAE